MFEKEQFTHERPESQSLRGERCASVRIICKKVFDLRAVEAALQIAYVRFDWLCT